LKRPPGTKRVHRWVPAALAGVAIAFAAATTAATPSELYGAGPESTALAGAGVSLPLDAESALLNPAELPASKKQLGFGIRESRFALELGREGREEPFSAETANGFYLGVVAPLSTGDFESAFGLFAGSPPDFIVRAHLPFTDEPDFPLLVGRSNAFDLAASLGLKHDFWSVGVGLRVLAALTGTVGVVDRNGSPQQVVNNELVPAIAPVFGVGFEPGGDFSIGAKLRTELRANFDVTLATTGLGAIPLPPMHIQGVAHYEPLRVDLEVSRRFGASTGLVALSYERWSDYPGTLGQTVQCAEDEPDCGAPMPPSPNASDVFVPRLAGAHDFVFDKLRATVRAGYAFAPAALPEQTRDANQFDSARHAFSLGYSLALPPDAVPLHLDAAFRLDVLVPRTHEKPDGSELGTSGVVETFVFGARVEL
jgi:long-chain fatty acid transport protein